MKKAACFGLMLLLTVAFVSAQAYKGEARVFGFVYDEDGNPLEGVKVKFTHVKYQDGFEISTDAKGKWIASWIRGGDWKIEYSKIGYMPFDETVKLRYSGRNPEIETTLNKIEGLLLTDNLIDELKEGNDLFDKEDYNGALSVYEKILGDFPDAYIINKNIGNCYFQMEEYDTAIEYYQKVLEHDPRNHEIVISIGNCYANQGENEKAMEQYSKIRFEEMTDAIVLYNIGSQFFNLGNMEEAVKYFQRAVELQEDFLDAVYQLGVSYLSIQNNEKAIQAFEGYLKHDPDSPKAAQVRSFLDYLKKN
jgi:tetratricopeptide (TPR) repeat protein